MKTWALRSLTIFFALAFLPARTLAVSNFQQARFHWDWKPDGWTQAFRVDCGRAPGKYLWKGQTTSTAALSLAVAAVIARVDGTYYCVVRGVRGAETTGPSKETVFSVVGNRVFPQ